MANRIKKYTEDEIIDLFNLQRLVGNEEHYLMQEWTNTATQLNHWEQCLFNSITENILQKVRTWNEEALKMNFIAFVLKLGHLEETKRYKTYYESLIEATVDKHFLKIRTDMMIASGLLEKPKTPYFYFQEYKKTQRPQRRCHRTIIRGFFNQSGIK